MQTEPCQLLQTDSRRDSNDGRGLTAKAGLSACEATIRASEQEQGVHRYKQDNAESLREAFCILSEYSTKNNMIATTRREEGRREEKRSRLQDVSNKFESKVSISALHSSVSFSYWLPSSTDSLILVCTSAVELRVAKTRGSAWPRIVRVAFKILKQHFVDTSQLSSPNLAVPYLCLLSLASWRSSLENYERTVQNRFCL